MAIGTGAAILGAAAIGGSLLGASKASKATKYASDQQAQASREANELNRYIYDTQRSDNETRRNVGDSSLLMLANIMGVPGGARPASGAGAAMTGGGYGVGGKTTGGFAGTSPAAGYSDAARNASRVDEIGRVNPNDGQPSMAGGPGITRNGIGGMVDRVNSQALQQNAPGGVDYARLRQERPDVVAQAEKLLATADRNSPWFAQHGLDRGVEGFIDWWGKNQAPGTGYELPRLGATPAGPAAPAATPQAPWVDPTTPGGYMVGARPDMGAGPTPYQASARQAYVGPNLSYESYENSPDHKFRMSESQKELDRLSSAGRGVYTGRRMIAGIDRAQGVASQGYTDWRNFTQGQANVDRARGDAIYSEERGFGYGQARDARGDFMVDRTRSDGLYADDRGYTTGRYDQRNNTLLNLAGFGPQAAASNASAAQSFAQSTNANNMAAANAKGDAAIGGANAWNGALGNLMTSGAYLYGQGAFGGGSKLPQTYNI